MKKLLVGLVVLSLVLSVFVGFGSISFAQKKYNEAPMLAELVKAGKLPPVDQRLPKNPAVLEPVEKVGKYGGTVRMIRNAPESFISNYDWLVERGLRISHKDRKTIEPNVIESWKISRDGTEFTLKIREGLRWSDGAPVTTEDVRFWYEDVLCNTELTPVFPRQIWSHGGKPVKCEIVDKYTFKLKFAKPFGTFPLWLTRLEMGTNIIVPSHALKKYHIKYAKKEDLERLMKEYKYDQWFQLFSRFYDDAGIWDATAEARWPTLSPWVIAERPSPGVVVLERNPYYWKVDTEGNQLPYIDKIRTELVNQVETMNMKVISGELDWLGQHDTSIAYYPIYKKHEKDGDYRVLLWEGTMTDKYFLLPNHTHPDPVMRKLICNPLFKRALSLAINRDEINQVLYFGLAKPSAATVVPWSSYYEEKFSKAYAEYNPQEANKLLDSLGLNKRDKDGYRLRPDGKRLSIVITHSGTRVGTATDKFVDMIAGYWRDIGIDAKPNQVDEQLRIARYQANELDMFVWHLDRTTDMLFPIDPIWFIPMLDGWSYGRLWEQWYNTQGKRGERPPEDVLKLYDIYEKMQETTSEKERIRLGRMILDAVARNLYVIGVVTDVPVPLVVSNRLRNVPEKGVIGWDTFGISLYHPEQFFIEK
jgi:peptide/nickel transport system substrate-binding protein